VGPTEARTRLPSGRTAFDARLPSAATARAWAPALAAGVAVGALGARNGGYFPVAWGWAALCLFVHVAMATVIPLALP